MSNCKDRKEKKAKEAKEAKITPRSKESYLLYQEMVNFPLALYSCQLIKSAEYLHCGMVGNSAFHSVIIIDFFSTAT